MASKSKASHSLNWEDVRDKLRSWREDNVRQSEEVIELWEDVLQEDIRKLRHEMWDVYEQVCKAAYDCQRLDIAEDCIRALNKQFPDSLRVRILLGMRLEMLENYDEALKVYDAVLSKDKSNWAAQKRKIAILKAQGKITDAIKELADYLKKFMSDQEGWLELCDLYIQEQEYNKAAFCLEELILFNPHNHLYHQRYAEIRYTQGGIDNMELARAYFSQAIKINPNNLRALYGLCIAASNISSSPKCPAQKKKENQKYASWAAKQIVQRQRQNQNSTSSSLLKVIENMLSTVQLGSSH